MLISIVIRTYNEARYLDQLLTAIASQEIPGHTSEVIVVDSGSTDNTLEIASSHHCRIIHIVKEQFSFGRSLNVGCAAAKGEILVFISGHCIPVHKYWLKMLCTPLIENMASYTYGRQLGGKESYFSEKRIFAKYYPEYSSIPQKGFFCNNANAAIQRTAWEHLLFDEELTGLEDMELASRLTSNGGEIAYVAEAAVFHLHNEDWPTVQLRFEREALALQKIMPHVHIRRRDLIRYILCSIWQDWCHAWHENVLQKTMLEIVKYRVCQYWGSFKGNRLSRKLSRQDKEVYFYPSTSPALAGLSANAPANHDDAGGWLSAVPTKNKLNVKQEIT